MRFILSLLVVFSILSCGKESPVVLDPVISFTLTVTSGVGGGVSSPGGSYTQGKSVSITATPDPEYVFVNWSNGSTDNPLSVTVNSNQTVTANFEKRKYPLTVSITGSGTVSEEIISAGKSTTEYNSGSIIQLTAVPTYGWEFSGWSGSVSGVDNPIELSVNEEKTITALFKASLFESTSERYSTINETTRYFSLTNTFKRYISLQEAEYLTDITGNYFSNFDAITYDINEDGKLDLFWFGMSANIWGGLVRGSHSNGKYFIISDYFGKNAPYKIIEYNSSVEFAAAGVNAQDIDGDGIKEILIYSNNVHQINTYLGESFYLNNSNPPEELGTVILKIDNNFNLISEEIVGTAKALHRGSSGDVDNDGDIDILNFPTGHPVNQTIEQRFPTILYNDGVGNFTEELIFKNTNLEDYYYSMGSTVSHLFDMDGDGFLDLIFGRDIGVPGEELPFVEGINLFVNENTQILWGDGSGKFSWENKSELILNNELNCIQILLGVAFTDYDSDGDVDLVLQTTKEYSNYILNLFENIGNRSFEDVTVDKIDGYYHFETEHLGDMGEMMSIDKDGDGDYDLVPKDVKVFCCYFNDNYNFVSDLYWENTGGDFIRRIND
ncbi:VCBS repeat-containing protein [Flavobacteriaceae bacterium]|nr:VCBS repeat-containing protein [Flavobacteriaceae bacterium]